MGLLFLSEVCVEVPSPSINIIIPFRLGHMKTKGVVTRGIKGVNYELNYF